MSLQSSRQKACGKIQIIAVYCSLMVLVLVNEWCPHLQLHCLMHWLSLKLDFRSVVFLIRRPSLSALKAQKCVRRWTFSCSPRYCKSSTICIEQYLYIVELIGWSTSQPRPWSCKWQMWDDIKFNRVLSPCRRSPLVARRVQYLHRGSKVVTCGRKISSISARSAWW